MIVIIEGLDGVGKTTLSKQFAEKYNFEYIKESYTDDCKEKENRIKLLLERLLDNKNYIYDRTTLIDDFVYSFLNETRSTLLDHFKIIVALLSECKIFHLEIDEKIRKKRFNERGDQYITNDNIKQIAKQYKNFYTNLNTKNVCYFKLTSNLDKDINRLMKEIEND